MKTFLMVLGGIFLVLIVVLVIAGIKAKADFQPAAEKILVDCRDGKIDQVYADATQTFRDSISLADFKGWMQARDEWLGKFRGVEKMIGFSKSTSNGVSQGIIRLVLKYEKGETKGVFHFQEEEDTWKLLGLNIVKMGEDLPDDD